MMTVDFLGSLLLGGLAAVLFAAAAAKAFAAWQGHLSWPDPTLAGVPVPAGAVIAVEAGSAITVLAVPTPAQAGLALAGMYAGLSVAAVRLRGRTCGCFGLRSSVVGPGHIAGTVAACAAALVTATFTAGWGLPIAIRAAALMAGAAAILIVMAVRSRRAEARQRADHAAALDPAHLAGAAAIVVITKPGCPHSAVLRLLLEGMINERLLRWIDLGDDPGTEATPRSAAGQGDRDDRAGQMAAYRALGEDGTPCALAVDLAGRPVTAPQWGTQNIPHLIDAFLLARQPGRPRLPQPSRS